MTVFAGAPHTRICPVCSKEYSTSDTRARWTNAKGNPRYLCPLGCEKPGAGWKFEGAAMLSGEVQSSSQCRQLKPWETYCPICGCVITASNIADFDLGKADGYLFVHPGGVNHNLDDIEALAAGVQ